MEISGLEFNMRFSDQISSYLQDVIPHQDLRIQSFPLQHGIQDFAMGCQVLVKMTEKGKTLAQHSFCRELIPRLKLA